jgi:cytosine deaminase
MIERALAYCDWAVARGLLAIRSHVDTSDPSLLPVEAMLEVKRAWRLHRPAAGRLPAGRRAAHPGGVDNLKRALDLGVDVVGGIPHFERTMAEGAASVKLLCELAAERGKLVDMHCDETDDPLSRHIETLAFETQRLGLQGRVNGSHCTSMHSMDNYYVSKLLPLIAESGVSVIANPLINITLQGRHDTYPKRRGMTRVPELMAAGVNVAFGHDCVMDPWYGMGSGDMLEVAHMGLHVAQMTSQKGIRACFDAVTVNAAKVMHLDGYGHRAGCDASFVLLQARDPVEAIRLRANRLKVWRKGQLLPHAVPRPLHRQRLGHHLDAGLAHGRGHDVGLPLSTQVTMMLITLRRARPGFHSPASPARPSACPPPASRRRCRGRRCWRSRRRRAATGSRSAR